MKQSSAASSLEFLFHNTFSLSIKRTNYHTLCLSPPFKCIIVLLVVARETFTKKSHDD